MHAHLQNFVATHIGPAAVESETPWGYRGSYVAKLRDQSGTRWYLKLLRDRECYRNELTAYQRWTPQLDGRAPILRGYDDAIGALVISAVPGESALGSSNGQVIFHEAGAMLLRLHEADRLPPINAAEYAFTEFEKLEPQAAFVLDWRILDRARALLRDVSGTGLQEQVPCHHDFSPRNWLVDKGMVRIIDFEWATGDVWVADLVRLRLGGWWRDRPDLEEAFHAGYGRWPDDAEETLLRACAIVNMLRCVVVARLRGDPGFESSSTERLMEVVA